MKKRLSARLAAVVTSISVGLGFTQLAAADTYSTTASPPVARSTIAYDGVNVGITNGIGAGAGGSSLSALATKLGEKEETVADALVAVREQERSAAAATIAVGPANGANHRGTRQATVARALAAELGIDSTKVSMSLTELQAERKAAGAGASL